MAVVVHWLGESASLQAETVGGKAANLGHLSASHPVPPGFCVTGQSPDELAGESSARSVAAAYRELGVRSGQSCPAVAVRSSAIDEDGAEASFAGLNETYLNVTGETAVMEAVRACVTSFGSERARAYRADRGLEPQLDRFAVLVQQLVTADVSGVVFSVDPVTGHAGTTVVNASWGLGESVVGGTVTPDAYRVDRATWTVTHCDIADKTHMTIPAPGGVREVAVPRQLRPSRVLSDDAAVRTGQLAVELEAQMGWPTDVEFAWSDGRLNLLQCRPVTGSAMTPHGRES